MDFINTPTNILTLVMEWFTVNILPSVQSAWIETDKRKQKKTP